MGAELEHWKAAYSLRNYADGPRLVAKTRPFLPPALALGQDAHGSRSGQSEGFGPRFKVAVSIPFVHMDSRHVSTDSNPDRNDPPT